MSEGSERSQALRVIPLYGNLEEGDGTTVEFTTQLDTPTGYTTVTAAVIAGPTPDKLFVDVEVTQP